MFTNFLTLMLRLGLKKPLFSKNSLPNTGKWIKNSHFQQIGPITEEIVAQFSEVLSFKEIEKGKI